MARIDIKGISKLADRLKIAALAYSDATRKVMAAKGASSKSLRVAEANDAFEALVSESIAFVGALATADDGKEFRDKGSIESWIRMMVANDCAFASTFRELKKAPYARVFARAEKEARRG